MTGLSRLLSLTILRLVTMVVRALPPRSIPAVGWLAGTIWYVRDGRRRARIAENLRVAFGSAADGAAGRRLARRVFRNMARVPIEVLWFERLLNTPGQIERRCTFHGDWPEKDASGGGIVFTGHLGNWEAVIRTGRHRLGRFRTIVRPIKDPGIEALTTRARGGPASVIAKRGGYRDVVRSVREGWWVGIAGDQNAGASGIFIPFFGLAASTHETPARLALREGVPLVMVLAIRRPGTELHYDIHLEQIAHPAPTRPDRDEIEGLQRLVNRRLEAWIRRTPEQYNFLHRRWKDRPPGEAPGAHLPAYDHHRPLPSATPV